MILGTVVRIKDHQLTFGVIDDRDYFMPIVSVNSSRGDPFSELLDTINAADRIKGEGLHFVIEHRDTPWSDDIIDQAISLLQKHRSRPYPTV